MVAIGSCDTCGEFCQSLGVNAIEFMVSEDDEGAIDLADFEEIEDEDEDDREARLDEFREERLEELREEQREGLASEHNDLVMRRVECAEQEGYDWVPGRHVGPWHDAQGKPLDWCPNCDDDSEMDLGDWDSSLDHAVCLECWADIAGGRVLWKRRASESGVPTPVRPPMDEPYASTERADRPRLEAAFAAYLLEPLPFRWVPSPIGVVQALADAVDFDPEVDSPWSAWAADPVLIQALAEGDFRSDALPRDLGGPIASAIAGALAEQDLGGLESEIELVTQILADAGQFDGRRALLRALAASGRSLAADEGLLRLLSEACNSAGPLAILPGEIVVSDRPLVLELDDRGRLHRDDGPAIAYGDGLTVYASHGTVVPGWVIEQPERLHPTVIDAEPNVEVRRVMIERMGAERLVREGGAELIHEDETGRLWRRSLGGAVTHNATELVHENQTRSLLDRINGASPRGNVSRDEPVVMVEVLNSTPEPDGSRKTYFLRVPPTMGTAREAVAWTFGMGGADYRPRVET